MKALIQKIRRILKDRRTRQMLTRIISVTAAVVVFVTTYALVLPAITMETEAQCGIEAHQHSDECYTEELVCEIPETPGHSHSDVCYELSQVLVCETPEHKHSVENDCYDEDGNLICELVEHHHTVDDGCYNEVKELVCDIPESEGHTHDSSCYKKVLTCGKEVHTHSTDCYHIDAASKAATEAAAVASTESAAIAGTESMMSTKASTTSEAAAFTDNLSDYEIDESNVGTIGTATSTDLENVDATSTDADAAGADPGGESGTWTPAEETVDSAATETDGGAEGSTASAASSSATSSTSSTASTTEKATEENAGYVPVLEELNINAVINNHTGIYYYHPESDSATDSNEASTEDSDGTVTADNNNNTVAVDNNDDSANTVTDGSAIPAEDWHRIPNNTEHGETPELGESDLLRIYLAYTIPAGSLNETNTVTRYRLPANIRLSDDQIDTINSTVNGIAAQYVNMDTLEILDVDQYNASLGIEAVEGTRTPDQDIQAYLNDLEKSGKEASEYITATVRVESVFDEDSGDYEGQDLVFTFTPYSILKNQHEYAQDGQPTRAGEELQGWVSLDLTTDQIEWITSDNDDKKAVEKTADIVFVEKDQELDVDEISTELKLVEKASADDIPTEKADAVDTAEATEVNETEDSMDEEKEDNKAEATEDDETAENEKAVEEPAVNYPSVSFDDSITVTSGTLSTDTTGAGAEENTEITVHVEADEDTFPEGTTMRLAAVTDDQMAAVTEAVEGAMAEAAGTQGTAGRTQGFHALDISFWNADGIEIEPLKPIRVSMTSEAIKRAVEDSATAPVVVHVEDGHAAAAGDSVDEDAAASEESVVEPADNSQIAATSSDSETVDDAEAGSQTLPTASIIETATGETKEENTDTLTFEAGAFSVYAIVYTVDFEYSVNGKMYQFSLPGGGFVSFTDLIEVLGIPGDTYSDENEAVTEDRIIDGMLDVTTSDAAKKFVAEVESVEFSSPELVWVGKVDAETTVGALKEANGLECEYSAELTEEQIDAINGTKVESGDWALIALQPFTSEEYLTVTMKTGEVFEIRVTDAQISTHVLTASGDTYRITVTYDDTAEITENAELRAREITEEDEDYRTLCDEADQALIEKYDTGLEDPILFDIGIYVEDEEIEPAEGSIVKVEIWLASSARDEEAVSEEGSEDDDRLLEGIWINGQRYTPDGTLYPDPVIIHHTGDGAVVLSDIEHTEEADGSMILQFETESFSSYTITNNSTDLNGLPSTLYVGDEIYLNGSYTSSNYITVEGGYTAQNRGDANHRVIKLDKEGTLIIGSKRITVKAYPTQSTTPGLIKTGDNDEAGIKLNLFDYDPDGVLNEAWNTSGYSASKDNPYKYYYNYGINNNRILKFWTGCPGYDTPYNNSWDVGQTSASPGIVSNTLSGGYPTVTKGSKTDNLSYLFAPESNGEKTCYSNVDGLFKKDADGYYVYDSYTNYAYFNGKSFEVYNETFDYGTSSKHKIGFFPFHPYNKDFEKNLSTISGHQQMNHHFGLTMEVDFVLPDDGVDPITGKDIIFKFNGDDDLWVYVDNNLRLDLGGIHQPVDGEINFTQLVKEGKISTGDENTHTLKVFYIERGGGDSNCKITFNTTRYKDVRFEKKGDENNLLNGAKFQLFKEDGVTPVTHVKRDAQGNLVVKNGVVQTEDWIVEAGNIDNKDGQVVFRGVPVGNYVIKEIEPPEGYRLDGSPFNGKVYISNNSVIVEVKDKNGVPISEIINQPYTTDVTVKKTDGHTFLPGAKFRLRIATDGGQYVDIPNVPEFTVEDEGGYKITGLKAGKYQLTETEVPKGYIVVNAPIEFEIKRGSTGESLVVEYKNTDYASLENGIFTVINTPGAALPNTGGPGTRIFTIFGSILILGAGLLLWRRRRLI